MEWWQSLNIYEHILLVIALASTVIILTKAIMTVAKFYSVDKLNSEAEDVELYENVANNDSDIVRHTPRFISVTSINVFLASGSWSYFLFRLFSTYVLSAVFALLAAIIVLVLYAVIDYIVRKSRKVNKINNRIFESY